MEFHVIELPKLPEEGKEDSSDLLLWAKFLNADAKGRAEGIEIGKLEAAKELLASGVDEETVMKSLKLSDSQIRTLKES